MRSGLLGAVLVLGLANAGCGSDDGTTTVTERRTTTVIREAPPESPDTPDAGVDDTTGSSPESDAAPPSGRVVVPDVVGKDHQLAQDTMQAAGLYNLSEEDATGQDRLMLVDRNWEVVEQAPPAGTRVNEDATIILRSKKDGE